MLTRIRLAPLLLVCVAAGGGAVPFASAQDGAQGYTYDAHGRRDPFVSVMKVESEPLPTIGGRPAGLAGLSVSEVVFKGTLNSARGYVGLLQGTDTKTYIVRRGDRLFDATVGTITANTVVFRQQEAPPLQHKTREIRRVLRETEEVK